MKLEHFILAFVGIILVFGGFAMVVAEPKSIEQQKLENYERCTRVLYMNGQAEKIPNCEYLKK